MSFSFSFGFSCFDSSPEGANAGSPGRQPWVPVIIDTLSPVGTARTPLDTPTFQRGLELFNAREYFDAHEVWEDIWRAAPVEEKKFLQGLIQVAVALHHHGRGNLEGARSLLGRAQRNLSEYPDTYSGVNLAAVRAAIIQGQQALSAGAPLPPFRISIA